jgi:hypothetical protein
MAMVVVMPTREYELEHIEDKFWFVKAEKAHEYGYLGTKKSSKLLNKLLDETALPKTIEPSTHAREEQ